MTKILNGKELSGYIKERQAKLVRSLSGKKIVPTLLIIRENDNPVIKKYVELKKRYGADIGVRVIEFFNHDIETIKQELEKANLDSDIHGIIVQLPLTEKEKIDEVVSLIKPEKDVDGLSGNGKFDSATATAINWLLAGYNIELENKKIALVGRGRLVGAPLIKMFSNSNYDFEVFHRGSDLTELKKFDIIITATGIPKLIKSDYIKNGAIVVDAGTASESGMIVGDIEDELRERKDLKAVTPRIGGVGPLTVNVLFDNVITAATISSSERR